MLRVRSVLLDFSAFPYTTHNGSNIAQWIVNVLAKYGLKLSDIRTVVPDGASNGLKALKTLHVPFEVCYAHNLARCLEIAFGRGSKVTQNDELKKLIRKHDRIAQKFHQSTKCTKLLHEVPLVRVARECDQNARMLSFTVDCCSVCRHRRMGVFVRRRSSMSASTPPHGGTGCTRRSAAITY